MKGGGSVVALCCTYGRYRCLQRALKCYIDQDYLAPSILFICNSGAPLKLPDDFKLPPWKQVYIDNCSLMNFQSVGEKYYHALRLINQMYPEADTLYSHDDDDIFLANHITEGVQGFLHGCRQHRCKAYKPQQSWFRYRDESGVVQIVKQENTFEPSIFVDVDWVLKHGYAPVSIRYHQQWLDSLLYENKLFVDPQGKPTLIYNWGDNTNGPDSWGIYKMSGAGVDNQNNFLAHARTSRDMGDGILVPAADNSEYYKVPIIS
jgi:hypothetical protein